jgi:hypothetical protein
MKWTTLRRGPETGHRVAAAGEPAASTAVVTPTALRGAIEEALQRIARR